MFCTERFCLHDVLFCFALRGFVYVGRVYLHVFSLDGLFTKLGVLVYMLCIGSALILFVLLPRGC